MTQAPMPQTQKAAVCHGALDLRIVSPPYSVADSAGGARSRGAPRGLRHDQDGSNGTLRE